MRWQCLLFILSLLILSSVQFFHYLLYLLSLVVNGARLKSQIPGLHSNNQATTLSRDNNLIQGCEGYRFGSHITFPPVRYLLFIFKLHYSFLGNFSNEKNVHTAYLSYRNSQHECQNDHLRNLAAVRSLGPCYMRRSSAQHPEGEYQNASAGG